MISFKGEACGVVCGQSNYRTGSFLVAGVGGKVSPR